MQTTKGISFRELNGLESSRLEESLRENARLEASRHELSQREKYLREASGRKSILPALVVMAVSVILIGLGAALIFMASSMALTNPFTF
jgi:hypothetical protein